MFEREALFLRHPILLTLPQRVAMNRKNVHKSNVYTKRVWLSIPHAYSVRSTMPITFFFLTFRFICFQCRDVAEDVEPKRTTTTENDFLSHFH